MIVNLVFQLGDLNGFLIVPIFFLGLLLGDL